MSESSLAADLVLEGGGVLGIGHVGAISVLSEAGYTFPRVAGTSAGSIVGALVAAGMPVSRMTEIMTTLDYRASSTGHSWTGSRSAGRCSRC